MQVADSNLESLSIDYVRFGFLTVVNNVWTWVAVVTAALSFWRIRAAGGGSSRRKIEGSSTNEAISNGYRPVSAMEPPETSRKEPSTVFKQCEEEFNGMRKGRFLVYFEDERSEDEVDTGAVDDERSSGCDGLDGGEWWQNWERMLRIRNGEMEWYRFQDMGAINGSVIRLWDGRRRRRTEERERCSSSCAPW